MARMTSSYLAGTAPYCALGTIGLLTPPPPPRTLPDESTSAGAPADQQAPERLPSIVPSRARMEVPPDEANKSEQFTSSSGFAQRPVKREAIDGPDSDDTGASKQPPFGVKQEEDLERWCDTLSQQSLEDLLDLVDQDASSERVKVRSSQQTRRLSNLFFVPLLPKNIFIKNLR